MSRKVGLQTSPASSMVLNSPVNCPKGCATFLSLLRSENLYLSSFLGFLDARWCQVGVKPATESVVLIVNTLAVSNHYDLVCRRHCHELLLY